MSLMNRRELFALGLAGASATSVKAVTAQASDKRIALVIGNAAYENQPLENTIDDARLVTKSLKAAGWQVTQVLDADLPTMINTTKKLWLDSRDAAARLFYFSGHGTEHQGGSFLNPVKSEARGNADLGKFFSLDRFIVEISQSRQGVNVVVVDACRTSLNSRGVRQGLEPVVAGHGSLVAYSTSPRAIAYDGRFGHSPYARALAEQIPIPGQLIEQSFKRVREAVSTATNFRQIPWENSSLTGDFCLGSGRLPACSS